MINNNSLNKSESLENSDQMIIQNSEQEEEPSEKEKNEKDEAKNKNNELQYIKEEDVEFYPIMSRMQRDLEEKKKKKSGKKEETKTQKIKKGIGDKNSKVPFFKLANKDITSTKLNTLLTLEPFHTDFNVNLDKKGEEILKIISEEYKEETFGENDIIFRYGDEADRFFVLYEGNVTLFFPFTEIVNINIDEFYIYILRLRRYNEIEMLNNVLLLNQGKFMVEFDEGFNIDGYILQLYNTSLKLRFDSTFLNQNQTKKKVQKTKINQNKTTSVNKNKNIKNIKYNIKNKKKTNIYKIKFNSNFKITEDDNRFDDSSFKTFDDRVIKEMVIRIEDEIIETMKWIMPDKMYDIYEQMKDDRKVKKMVKIHKELIEKYKQYNTNIIKDIDYPKRILPPKINNKNIPTNEMIIMKYLYISTISKGHYFGDFCSDSLTLFCPKYLNYAKSTNIPLKMHNHYLFRTMAAISNTNNTHLLSFNKKTFYTYISKFIENKTLQKKKYLLYNPLFVNSTNQNLIRTYSICFKEKKIKEGEIIVHENDKLCESNINLFFIIKGEFQAYCKKSIYQIDEIIKLLGKGDHIIDTFPKELKSLVDTKYYEEIAKKVINIKLNYLTKNDIIGLSEAFINDKYFNNIICTNPDTKIYCVDMRIVKLLVDSDDVILDNKNVIIYHKYQMLADILLKQRKIYFDSFFNLEKHNINNNVLKYDNENNDIETENNAENSNVLIGDNFTNNIINKDKTNSTSIRTIQKYKEVVSTSFEEKINNLQSNQKIPKNIKLSNNKPETHKKKIKLVRNLGDLDRMLANLNSNFTLTDKRLERSEIFKKKYLKKMEKINQEKKLREEERKRRLENQGILRRTQSNFNNIKTFQKSIYIIRNVFRELPLLPNKDNFIKSDGQYKLIIPYRASSLKKSSSANNINPLAYDDFNRYYNTTHYFQFRQPKNNFLEEKKTEHKKDYCEYNIEFKSDIKLKDKKDNKEMRNNLLTKKLRNLYQGKWDRILYKKK